MRQMIKQLSKGKRLAVFGLAALGVAVGLAAVAPAGNAAAVTCRVFTPVNNLYEGGSITSSRTYFVPGTSVSGCKDINVRNIQARDAAGNIIAGDWCATFTVQMFPTWGEDFYTPSKRVCSRNPAGAANGPVMPIATNVINGTEYRVWYNIEAEGRRHTFQIVD